MEKLIEAIDEENKEVYILGDLNCDMLRKDNEINTSTMTVKSLYEQYQLYQLIDQATRITMTTSSLIDHIVTNRPEKISDSGVIHTGISDHSLIFAIRKISIMIKQENTIEIRNVKNLHQQNFIKELQEQRWEYIYFFAADPNCMREIWKTLFLEVLNKHAPIQNKKVRSKNVPWITRRIKELIVSRDKLKRKAIITILETDWYNYKQIRNKINTELRNAKKEYYSSKIASQKQNPNQAWKTINNLLGRQGKKTVVNQLDIEGETLTNNEDIEESFNNYFSNIGPNLASKIGITDDNFVSYIKVVH